MTRNDPSVCARCARAGTSCCKLIDVSAEFCFPVSEAEQGRIREAVDHAGGFVLEDNTPAFLESMCRLFPGEQEAVRALFHPRKQHLRLAVDETGHCRFLGSEGCVIERELRPYYCRLYPFWVAPGGVTYFDSPTCLARREGATLPKMLQSLGTSRGKVKELYGRLRLAWGLSPGPGMPAVKRSF